VKEGRVIYDRERKGDRASHVRDAGDAAKREKNRETRPVESGTKTAS